MTHASPSAVVVLVVDDDERNRRLAVDVLVASGIRALEAENGATALAIAVAHRLDLILLDLQLPDIDGPSVARKLKGRPDTATIPLVALSALAHEDDEWLLAHGFAGAIAKPISVSGFPEQVRAFCSGR